MDINPYLEKMSPWVDTLLTQLWAFLSLAWVQASLLVLVTYFTARWVKKTIPAKINDFFVHFNITVNPALIHMATPPLYYAVLLSGLGVATIVAPFNQSIEFILIATLQSLMIAIITLFVINLSRFLLQLAADNPKHFQVIKPETVPLFDKVNLLIIIAAAIYFICGAWHIEMTALLASAGIAGLAVGMAAKDTLSDVISGVLILTDSPYKVGDVITLGNGDKGKITHIGIRSTRIETVEKVEITLPNTGLASRQIRNESGNSEQAFRRYSVDLHIAYGTPSDKIRQLVTEVVLENPTVLQDPPPSLGLCSFESHYILYQARFWVSTDELSDPSEEIREALYDRFCAEDIPLQHTPVVELKIKDLPALEAYIKEIPELYEKLSILDLPEINTKIKEMPTNREQTVSIKDMPAMNIGAMPNILGKPVAKPLQKNNTPAKIKPLQKPLQGDLGIKVKTPDKKD